MKKLVIEMPEVRKCDVASCAYNQKSSCHAKAITVGDAQNPNCDTFLSSSSHTSTVSIIAGVGACKVSDCRYNVDLECTADGIRVGITGTAARCMTYQKA